MDNEPYRDFTHRETIEALLSDARACGMLAASELRLPHGRIADVIIMTQEGRFTVIEVKTVVKPSLIASAYDKYWPYCNRLWVAVPGLAATIAQQLIAQTNPFMTARRVGIMGIDRSANVVYRKPDDHHLPAARQEHMRALLGCWQPPVAE